VLHHAGRVVWPQAGLEPALIDIRGRKGLVEVDREALQELHEGPARSAIQVAQVAFLKLLSVAGGPYAPAVLGQVLEDHERRHDVPWLLRLGCRGRELQQLKALVLNRVGRVVHEEVMAALRCACSPSKVRMMRGCGG